MTGYDDLQAKLASLRDGTATRMVLMEVGQAVVRQASINLQPHDRTGNLQRSLRVASVSQASQSVEVKAGGSQGVNYAAYLEFGTGIYGPKGRPIVPVRAKALRFPAAGAGVRLSGNLTKAQQRAGGGWQFRRSVRGVRPVRYMENAVKDVSASFEIAPSIVTVWNKA